MNCLNPIPEEGKKIVGMESGIRPDCGHSIFTIKVTHGPNQYEVVVPTNSTFGALKSVIVQKLGLRPETRKLLFRGKEKEDDDDLQAAGIKDHSKVLIVEDVTSRQKAPKEVKKEAAVISRGGAAVAEVRKEVDILAEQVSALQAVVDSGTKIDEKDIVYLSEMLMRQLLKLDAIDAEGEGRVQRKKEVCRVQRYADTTDNIKLKNSNISANTKNNVCVTTEAVEGSATASQMLSSTPTPVHSSTLPSEPSPAPVQLESAAHSTPSSTLSPTQSSGVRATPPTQYAQSTSSTKVSEDWEEFE